MNKMNPRKRTATIVAGLVAAAAIGGAIGAGTYALSDNAATTPSIGGIYQRTHRGVVEITATIITKPPLAQERQQAPGSGWVYDDQGRIVTDEHVVEDADALLSASGTARSIRPPSSAARARPFSRSSRRTCPRLCSIRSRSGTPTTCASATNSSSLATPSDSSRR